MPGRRNHYRDKSFERDRISANQTARDLENLGKNVIEAAKAALQKGAEAIAKDAKTRCHASIIHLKLINKPMVIHKLIP